MWNRFILIFAFVLPKSSGNILEPLEATYTCPDEFVMLSLNPQTVKCYSFRQNLFTYRQAVAECASLNSILSAPTTKVEVKEISDYVLKNLSLASRHYWITNNLDKVNYTENEPPARLKERITGSSNKTSIQHDHQSCQNMLVWVAARGKSPSIKWVDEICDKRAYPLCETEAIVNYQDERKCSVQCSSHTMRIVCDLKIFQEAVNRQVVLNNDECVARENKTHLIIHTALNECDTKAVNSEDNKVIYNNKLRVKQNGRYKLMAEVVCEFQQKNFISYEFNQDNVHNLLPSENQLGVVETGVQGIRSFKQFFLVYPNDKYDCPIQPDESPYTVRSTDTLYAEIRLLFPSNQVELHAVNCWVSDTKEGKNRRYDLLKNGCAQPNTGFRFYEKDSDKKIVRFSFGLSFAKSVFKEIYVHCSTIVCVENSPHSTKCNYKCNKRQKRLAEKNMVSPGEVMRDTVISPIIIIVDKENNFTNSRSSQKIVSTVASNESSSHYSFFNQTAVTEDLSSNILFDNTTHAVETSKIKKTSSKRMSSSLSKDDSRVKTKSEKGIKNIKTKIGINKNKNDKESSALGIEASTTLTSFLILYWFYLKN